MGRSRWWRQGGSGRVTVLVLLTVIMNRYPARGDETCLLLVGEPGHQRAELGADLLDLLVVLGLAALEEVRLARVELLDQLPRERAVLDLAQDAAHLLTGLLVDQPRAAGV